MKKTYTWFSKEEIGSWPEGYKRCRVCLEVKPFSAFHKNRATLFGVNTECKECRLPKSKAQYQSQKRDIQKLLWSRAKGRATKYGIPFDIELSDVVVPDTCPVFGTKFVFGDHDLAPSLDKIRPELGYVKGNVIVVSNKANIIKSNATPEEIVAVGQFFANLI